MAKQSILIAARELRGGVRKDAKDPASAVPHVTPMDTRLDAAELSKLGLSRDDLPALIARGDVVERDAFVAGSDSEGHGVPGTTGSAFEGLTADDMRKSLDAAKVKYPKDASPADLMKIAIEHQAAPVAAPGAAATASAAGATTR